MNKILNSLQRRKDALSTPLGVIFLMDHIQALKILS